MRTAGVVIPAGLAVLIATEVGMLVDGEVSGRDADGGEERSEEDGELHSEGRERWKGWLSGRLKS
jgi:hypothetical protein